MEKMMNVALKFLDLRDIILSLLNDNDEMTSQILQFIRIHKSNFQKNKGKLNQISKTLEK